MGLQRPTHVDTTKRNPKEYIYIKGDEFTDESIRVTVAANGTDAEVEYRETGVWITSGVTVVLEVEVITAVTGTVVDQDILLVDDDTAGSEVTITLPDAADFRKTLYIKKIGNTALVVIQPQGGELLDGNTSDCITYQYNTMALAAHGNNWHII